MTPPPPPPAHIVFLPALGRDLRATSSPNAGDPRWRGGVAFLLPPPLFEGGGPQDAPLPPPPEGLEAPGRCRPAGYRPTGPGFPCPPPFPSPQPQPRPRLSFRNAVIRFCVCTMDSVRARVGGWRLA